MIRIMGLVLILVMGLVRRRVDGGGVVVGRFSGAVVSGGALHERTVYIFGPTSAVSMIFREGPFI